MTEYLTLNTITSLKVLFQKKPERNVIIDPFCCLIKLSLLRFLDAGTKISIHQNRIHFNSPTFIQGVVRFIYGDNREHLHNLYMPIKKCVEWFWNDKNPDMTYMFNNAVIGLKMLKAAYGNYDTIQHTLNYFIIILMQKNPSLIGKLGIKSLDIDILTTDLLDDDISNSNPNNMSSLPITDNANNNAGTNTVTNNEKKKKNNRNDEQIIQQQPQTVINNESQPIKDMHKFLFDLWNQREIGIVINLYKEMEAKTKPTEREHIYANIMNYCSMKEDLLYNYIEQNSSFLQ
jgi:hypothetical protein